MARRQINIAPAASPAQEGIAQRVASVREAISTEYQKRHSYPWIVAFSGGKDSTILLQLVFEHLLTLPKSGYRREIHVIGNDTLVESPLVIGHLKESLKKISEAAVKYKLPVNTVLTTPSINQTFWVNVIGRGYIPPTRNFRWCTDRLKIQPTSGPINRLVRLHKQAVLLVGTRKAESQSRKRRMEKREGSETNEHDTIKECQMFAPLAELSDDDVWITLLQRKSPWGGDNRALATLYRNGSGGECPFVLTKDDTPSCGTSSPRFGCWTCTVVAKDRSLSGLIDSGFEEFEPLFDFREKLASMREDPANRQEQRRTGQVKFRNGHRVLGPFKLGVRKQILAELIELEKQTGRRLISDMEIKFIKDIWRKDGVIEQSRRETLIQMQIAA